MKKRVVSLLLALSMVFGLAACGGNGDTPSGSESGNESGTEGDTDADNQGGTENGGATYTLNLAQSTFPTNWNPHEQQTSTDADLTYYLQEPFYNLDFNDTMDGYEMVPMAAAAEPVDVTADYVGKYGIQEGDTAKAWKIQIRDDLKWQDGTPITAEDYVISAKLLLNPVAHHYRADSLYQGNLVIYNAKNYAYSGQYAQTPMISENFGDDEYVDHDDFVVNEEGYFTTEDGKDVLLKIDSMGNWDPDNGMDVYHDAYPDWFQVDGVDVYTDLFTPNADADGYVKVNEEVYQALLNVVGNAQAGGLDAYVEAKGDYAYHEWEEICYYGETYPEMDFSEVGIFSVSDTELVLALENPLEGFYLLYSLTDSWLVKADLYEQCETVTDGVYNNTYGTSAETSFSFGPYKLVSFQADKQIQLERNEYYHGIQDGQYQTTNIQIDCVEEAATRLEMFLNGQLDSYGLSAEDMETYQTSDYTYFTPGDSVWFMALNPGLDALKAQQEAAGENINKTILTVKEFRMALSFALDRQAFALATLPTQSPGFALFSDLIISNPETGESYRSTDEAKQVLVNFWGLADEVGDGKMYATLDDAIDSITGYNLEMAKEYFNRAYDIAIEQGLMDEDDVIQIKIGMPNSTSSVYNNGYEFMVNNYTEAVKGTKLEGKLTFTKDDTLGNGFADALKANQVDMLFYVGWTGSALDPYGLMEAYTTNSYQYDSNWDTSKTSMTVNLSGTDYTASVLDWTYCIGGQEITITAAAGTTKQYSAGTSDGVDEERFQILTGLENAVLEQYDMIPIEIDASAGMRGMQVKYYSEEYVFGPGRNGYQGVQYLTYNYNDQEWADYIASQGGTLNYN